MKRSKVAEYKNPVVKRLDVLSEFLRESAQKLLQLAVEAEVLLDRWRLSESPNGVGKELYFGHYRSG